MKMNQAALLNREAWEKAGVALPKYDVDEMVKALCEFYSSSLLKKGSKVYF